MDRSVYKPAFNVFVAKHWKDVFNNEKNNL